MIDQRNVDLQSVKVRFLCGHGHRELKFRRNKLKYLSRVFGSRLNELKDTDKVLLIKQDEFHNTGFSCWTMDAVLRTWHSNTSEFQRSMDNKREPYFTMFEELHALSLLLYTWECRISDFTTFAEQTRDEEVRVGQKGYMTLFDKEAMNGDNATKWAFISLVFGWKEQFSQSFLAIQRLGVEAATQSSQSTIRSAPYASQSYEEDVLRDIIPTKCIEQAQARVCWFASWLILEHSQNTNRRGMQDLVGELKADFKRYGFKVELFKLQWDVNENFFKYKSVVDVYRICFVFLKLHSGKAESGGRFQRWHFRSPNLGEDGPAAILKKRIDEQHDRDIRHFLPQDDEQRPSVPSRYYSNDAQYQEARFETRDKFNSRRLTQLILDQAHLPDGEDDSPPQSPSTSMFYGAPPPSTPVIATGSMVFMAQPAPPSPKPSEGGEPASPYRGPPRPPSSVPESSFGRDASPVPPSESTYDHPAYGQNQYHIPGQWQPPQQHNSLWRDQYQPDPRQQQQNNPFPPPLQPAPRRKQVPNRQEGGYNTPAAGSSSSGGAPQGQIPTFMNTGSGPSLFAPNSRANTTPHDGYGGESSRNAESKLRAAQTWGNRDPYRG